MFLLGTNYHSGKGQVHPYQVQKRKNILAWLICPFVTMFMMVHVKKYPDNLPTKNLIWDSELHLCRQLLCKTSFKPKVLFGGREWFLVNQFNLPVCYYTVDQKHLKSLLEMPFFFRGNDGGFCQVSYSGELLFICMCYSIRSILGLNDFLKCTTKWARANAANISESLSKNTVTLLEKEEKTKHKDE